MRKRGRGPVAGIGVPGLNPLDPRQAHARIAGWSRLDDALARSVGQTWGRRRLSAPLATVLSRLGWQSRGHICS